MDFRIFPPTKIYIDLSPIHGLGVFAKTKISEGELIEECSVLSLPISNTENPDLLTDYRFNWPQGNTPTEQVLALGYASLYNHSNEPNAYWKSNLEKKTFEFYSSKTILAGEEIFVWYGDDTYWQGRSHIVLR